MDFAMLLPIILTVVFVIIVVGVMLLIALTRSVSANTVRMTSRRIVLRSAAPPDAVFSWLTQHCPTGYSVADHDPARGIVLLSSRPTAFTWGFFYPVTVSPEGTGTRVELGIKSRLFQYGPLVTRAHQKLAHALANLTQSKVEAS